jgi:hypothetical protein
VRVIALRDLYDALEREVAPRLESVLHSNEFLQATAVVAGVRSAVGATVTAVNTGLLHAVNLPAKSDIGRLRRQVGELDYEVRLLRMDLAARAEDAEPQA